MPTLNIRLPEDKHQRLQALAEYRQISVAGLVDELVTTYIANHDACLRSAARGARSDPKQALVVLDRLDDL